MRLSVKTEFIMLLLRCIHQIQLIFLLPLARRAANTRRPFAVAILSRKPCLFLLFLLEGWNVLFIFVYTILCYYSMRSGCKISDFFLIIKVLNHF